MSNQIGFSCCGWHFWFCRLSQFPEDPNIFKEPGWFLQRRRKGDTHCSYLVLIQCKQLSTFEVILIEITLRWGTPWPKYHEKCTIRSSHSTPPLHLILVLQCTNAPKFLTSKEEGSYNFDSLQSGFWQWL
jgi:hypothetical protein